MAEILKLFLWSENSMGKEGNDGYPQCFQKLLFQGCSSWDCLIKGYIEVSN